MIKRLVGLLILIGIIISCTPKKEITDAEIPKGIIPPDSMTAIITDMQYTEAILREYKRRGQHSEERAAAFYDQTFEKHGVTPERYKKSVAFYEQHLDTYSKIYTDVVSRLSELEAEVGNSSEQ